jgi:diacylglycerol O-acyltransferase
VKASNVTINDVVLALCAGALRRYLIEHQSLPDLPLTAAVSASLRATRAAAHQSLAANRRSGSWLCENASQKR